MYTGHGVFIKSLILIFGSDYMDIVLAAAKADNLVSVSLGLIAGKYHTWKIIHIHNPVIGFL